MWRIEYDAFSLYLYIWYKDCEGSYFPDEEGYVYWYATIPTERVQLRELISMLSKDIEEDLKKLSDTSISIIFSNTNAWANSI